MKSNDTIKKFDTFVSGRSSIPMGVCQYMAYIH